MFSSSKFIFWLLALIWFGLAIVLFLPPLSSLWESTFLRTTTIQYLGFTSILIVIDFFFVYPTSKDELSKKFKKLLLDNRWFLVIIIISAVLVNYLTTAGNKSSGDGGNSDIVTLLTVILAFLAILNFVFFEMNKKEIELLITIQNKKIDEGDQTLDVQASDERIASKIERDSAILLSLVHFHIYTFCSDDKKMEEQFNIRDGSRIIKTSIQFGRNALMQLEQIHNEEKFSHLFFKVKNNIAFAIALSFVYEDEDKIEAEKLSRENYNLYEKDVQGSRWKYVSAATLALVQLRFGGTSEEVAVIYRKLLTEQRYGNTAEFNVPDEDREQIKDNKVFIEKILALEKILN